MDFTPPSLSKSGLKMVCNVNIVKGNLKSENSQDYAQKPLQNCTIINSSSVVVCECVCHLRESGRYTYSRYCRESKD
jgi:hypothetical protein